MKIIEPSVELMRDFDGAEVMKFLEKCGRTAYKSENNITEGSAEKFIRNIIKRGHESVLEHFSATFKIICDRGVSHELVRHRLASFTQESTRFNDYSSDKFGNELTVIRPPFWKNDRTDEVICLADVLDKLSEEEINEDKCYSFWLEIMKSIDENYFWQREFGATPEQARLILPNSLKTEIVMTCNLREWRHFLKLRTAKDAHPQMRQIATMILEVLKNKLPVVFDDISA